MEEEKEIIEKYNICLSCFLQRVRKEFNLTQKELAILMNKSEITIRNYEKNRLKVTFEVLFFLIHYFGLSPYYIHCSFLSDILTMRKKGIINFTNEEIKKVIALLYENLKKIYNVDLLDLEKEKNRNRHIGKREIEISDFKKNTLQIEKTLLLKHIYRYVTTFYQVKYINKVDFKISLESKRKFSTSFFEKISKKLFDYLNFSLEYEFEENEKADLKKSKE